MNNNKCAACKWWGVDPKTGELHTRGRSAPEEWLGEITGRTCQTAEATLSGGDHAEAPLQFPPDFGCVLHEPRKQEGLVIDV